MAAVINLNYSIALFQIDLLIDFLTMLIKKSFFEEQVGIIHVDRSCLQYAQIIFVSIFWVDNIFLLFGLHIL